MRNALIAVVCLLLSSAGACATGSHRAGPTTHVARVPHPLPAASRPGTLRVSSGRRSRYVSQARAAQCTIHDVRAHVGQVGAATGSVAAVLTLQNSSSSACIMSGYPALIRLSARHRRMSTKLLHGGGMQYARVRPRFVLLPSGALASVAIQWGDNPAGRQTARSCRPSFYLTIRLPRGTGTQLVQTGLSRGPRRADAAWACGGYLTVSAIQPGGSPRHT